MSHTDAISASQRHGLRWQVTIKRLQPTPMAYRLCIIIDDFEELLFSQASAKYRPATEHAAAAEGGYMARDSSPTIQEFSARAVRAPMTVVTRLSTREPVLPETDQFGLEDA